MKNNPETKTVQITVAGKPMEAREGQTIVHALWQAGMASEVMTGCLGGVCGACTVSVRYPDGRKGGTELACLHQVEEGMQVFPFPVDPIPTKPPVKEPDAAKLREAYPTLDRCTKCESCTYACPMDIPVMDSVLRMQKGEVEQVAQDFTTCIHCGLCRAVCEDKVEPHQMGMWVRRSLGQSLPNMTPQEEPEGEAEREWGYLMEGTLEQRLERARQFRTQESLNSLEDSKE
ncbi:MAG: 4Fe-4S dicluster domain-containing protein [Candidatus Nitronauta litoralis]|uniref:4Fe-4S dicluster domain-containing protein n=1 Tax=Candidatus Nitronauta litoralis TaxID=2705533 RepID=A0A7T0BSV7_9BACT|nr:MAG: 4Fe-4S dicluster domain-containing protein [Candidatus Nitronauta litoralis]